MNVHGPVNLLIRDKEYFSSYNNSGYGETNVKRLAWQRRQFTLNKVGYRVRPLPTHPPTVKDHTTSTYIGYFRLI